MAKNSNTKSVSLIEEREALLLEQKRDTKKISPSGQKRVDRVHELKRLMAPYLAEIEEHKAHIFKEMDKKGVDVLVNGKGVEVVSRDLSIRENVDKDGLKAEFPEIAAVVIVESEIWRVNWKKSTTI